MRYLLMIYQEPAAIPPTEAEWGAMVGEYNAYTKWLQDTDQYLGGEALRPVSDATTVSVVGGRRVVTDGPFAETKEHLAGYYLISTAGPRRRDRGGRPDARRPVREDRGPADRRGCLTGPARTHHAVTPVRESAADAVARAFREEHGRCARHPDPRARRLRSCRGGRRRGVSPRAWRRWPRDGVPDRPGAWIVTAARNHAIDRIRRARRFAERAPFLARDAEFDAASRTAALINSAEDDVAPIPDDQLRLIFTCCHPALPPRGERRADPAHPRRPHDARRSRPPSWCPRPRWPSAWSGPSGRSATAGIAYAVPPAERLPDRLDSVLQVLYLIFNEGYEASAGDRLLREDLCAEAIRLARLLAALLPDEPEALGSLALMLLHDARRPARLRSRRLPRAPGGPGPVALGPPRRSRKARPSWSGRWRWVVPVPTRSRPRSRRCTTRRPRRRRRTGARSWACTACFARLAPSPIVDLNRAVALSMVAGSRGRPGGDGAAGLDVALATYRFYHAARADLLRGERRWEEADRGLPARAGADATSARSGGSSKAGWRPRSGAGLDG